MTQETKHTPTPWEVETNPNIKIYIRAGTKEICHMCEGDLYGRPDVNAAFIVRACNSHDALVEALKALLDNADTPPEPNCSCHIYTPCSDCVVYGGIREAIDLAEGALMLAGALSERKDKMPEIMYLARCKIYFFSS